MDCHTDKVAVRLARPTRFFLSTPGLAKLWHRYCYYSGVTNQTDNMTYRFSELTETLKTQTTFDKWVEARKSEAKALAYDNRPVIYKRELEHEIDNIDSLKKAYKPLKALRKKSQDYDALITIDNQGYSCFRVYFPISQKELDEAVEYRQKVIKELGKWGSSCISLDDAVWSVLHEKVYQTFSFTRPQTAIQSFDKYGSGLVRKMEVFGFK